MYDRSKCVGASDAVHIQAGNWAELFDRKTSPDLSSYPLPAELGHILEPFNLELFERDTGIEPLVDPKWQLDPMRLDGFEWCTYLPDGLADTGSIIAPIEAKAVNMMWKPENLLKKYMPQLQHAMRVMQAPYCYFSVLYLNTKYEWTKVMYDEPYDDALFEKEKLFYFMLERGIRPPEKKGRTWV
jgi:predicted phage-related endonuclease